MYDISVDVVKESRLEKQIHSMNKMSTDIEMGKDVKDRLAINIFPNILSMLSVYIMLHNWPLSSLFM